MSAVRAAWGCLLLLRPRVVVCALPHDRIDRATLAFARILGARQLVQAALIARRPSAGAIQIGAAVDALHAATMVILATVRPQRRKLASANALVAAALAVAGVHEARSVSAGVPAPGRAFAGSCRSRRRASR